MGWIYMALGARERGEQVSKFKVGERVAVYTGGGRIHGVVQEIKGDRILVRSRDDTFEAFFHPKQLRRLLPKKPRREFWVNVYADGTLSVFSNETSATMGMAENMPGSKSYRVREVRGKK